MFTVYLKPPLACSDGLPASYYAVLVVAKCHKTRGALPAIRSTSGSTQFRIFEIMASMKPCLSLSDTHLSLFLSLSLYIYIYICHRRICRHVKSTCTIRISADYGNPFNGKSRIRVYKCVHTCYSVSKSLKRIKLHGYRHRRRCLAFFPDAPVSNESPHSAIIIPW